MASWKMRARVYSAVRNTGPSGFVLRREREGLVRILERAETRFRRHLDIGTGTGDTLAVFPACDARVCVDASEAMLTRARDGARVVARAEHLPFPSNAFDLVTAVGVYEYLSDTRAFFDEVDRVLCNGGCFVVTTAPPGAFNHARRLLGKRLRLASAAEVAGELTRASWTVRGSTRAGLQDHWLVAKASA